jgi:hypothetical protein
MIDKITHPDYPHLKYQYSISGCTGWATSKKDAESMISKIKKRHKEIYGSGKNLGIKKRLQHKSHSQHQ